jgi:hypothetical protein
VEHRLGTVLDVQLLGRLGQRRAGGILQSYARVGRSEIGDQDVLVAVDERQDACRASGTPGRMPVSRR